MPMCLVCNKPYPDFGELARHIIGNKKSHRKGFMWASRYLTKQRELDRKSTFQERNQNRIPLTSGELANKRETVRELSGETTVAETYCPHCKRKTRQLFPIEYGESQEVWRDKGCLVVLCQSCRKE